MLVHFLIIRSVIYWRAASGSSPRRVSSAVASSLWGYSAWWGVARYDARPRGGVLSHAGGIPFSHVHPRGGEPRGGLRLDATSDRSRMAGAGRWSLGACLLRGGNPAPHRRGRKASACTLRRLKAFR